MSSGHERPELTPERRAYYEKIDKLSLAPLWESLAELVTPEPISRCQPHMWKYQETRDYLIEAGGLITAKEAERRVLVLENPGMRGESRITTSLYAGLQLVIPGEVAPAHRHTQSALRFVLEAGKGAYTAVGGEKSYMSFGDFVITPPWSWHDHGNDSSEPVIWLDGLDIPIVTQHFAASFAEGYGDDQQKLTREPGDSLARFGANMLPVDYQQSRQASPIFNYPYLRSREALETMQRQNEIDPCHGLKMRYINPVDGGSAMPTIAAHLQLLPKGFKSAPFRSTDATVYAVTEGRGRSTVDGQVFEWGPRDIFVVPSWKWVTHEADDEAVLFSFSDRTAQEKLGIYRQDRGNN